MESKEIEMVKQILKKKIWTHKFAKTSLELQEHMSNTYLFHDIVQVYNI
jgi:hypothetical protein